MRPGITPVALSLMCLMSLPLHASQPEGLVGKLLTSPVPESCYPAAFDTYMFFYDHELDPADTLTLDLALIPFRTGSMWISVSDSTSQQFMNLRFSSERVTNGYLEDLGLSYHRSRWNDVTVTMRPATQDYLVRVNGTETGPFPYDPYCEALGGCFSVNALSISSADTNDETVSWIDSISVFRDSAAGREGFFEDTFETRDSPPGREPGSAPALRSPVPRLR